MRDQIPDDLYYTREHYWIRPEAGLATIGLTDHAQNELGDVVYLELADWVSEKLNRGAELDPRDDDPIYEQR